MEERNAALREGENLSDTAGRVLGAAKNVYDIALWIGDECIYTGNLRKYLSYETSGFMTETWQEDSVYYNVLTLMDDGGVYEDRRVYKEVAGKLHLFAESVGLEKENDPVVLTEAGRYCTEQDYLVDLDGDGELESLFYGQSTLLVNGVNYMNQIERRDCPETECFYLWDIEPEDGYMEIGIWSRGPSNDDYVDLYYYNGEELKYVGILPGEPDNIVVKGDGVVSARMRLGILQTWFADADFSLQAGHELELVEPQLYYPENFSQEADRYTLLKPVRLYEAMDENAAYGIVEAGVRLSLPATDNKNFVQAVTEDGRTGYLYVRDYNALQKPDGGYYDDPVIDGLSYVD